MNKKKRIGSIKTELIKKSRDAALAAVEIFNNPNITFKSESFVVLIIIAWTYLLHAYYKDKEIEYRYFEQHGKRQFYSKTNNGAYKHWELERCLNCMHSPIDKDTANNLRFIIGLRHEIEHQMTNRINDVLSARFQACCLNYNEYIKKLFKSNLGVEESLPISIQFSTISIEQKELLEDHPELPTNIKSYVQNFDDSLTEDEFSNPKFSYRLLFVQKTANRKGQADRVIEFVKFDSQLGKSINKEQVFIKDREKPKFLPKQIVKLMKEKGYKKFSIHYHTKLWKSLDAKNPSKHFGIKVANKSWYWHESWINMVRDHCKENKEFYILNSREIIPTLVLAHQTPCKFLSVF